MSTDYEYIIVGSGAGGGTLAARLAEQGRKVLVLEAGGDPLKMKGGNAYDPTGIGCRKITKSRFSMSFPLRTRP